MSGSFSWHVGGISEGVSARFRGISEGVSARFRSFPLVSAQLLNV